MLTVPINYLTTLEDLGELIEAGVDKFYLGYMPKAWYQKYGWEISTNKRYFPVIPHVIEPEKAKELISFIHSKKKKVYLALNELYYSQHQYLLLFKIIDLFESLDIDAYIVSDLAFILAMKKRGIDRQIHLSSCAGLYNLSALSFYRQFGIEHFILPQELPSKEIVHFLENTPDEISFEVFLAGELCKFNNAFCFTSHGFNRENFCSTRFDKSLINKKSVSRKKLDPSFSKTAIWCGLCIISRLMKFRERTTFKLPLRGTCASTYGIETLGLAKKVAKLLKRKSINMKQCREVLGKDCKKHSVCAYKLGSRLKL